MMTPKEREALQEDAVKVTIKYRKHSYTYRSEDGVEAQRKFLRWLKLFIPEAYNHLTKTLRKEKEAPKKC